MFAGVLPAPTDFRPRRLPEIVVPTAVAGVDAGDIAYVVPRPRTGKLRCEAPRPGSSSWKLQGRLDPFDPVKVGTTSGHVIRAVLEPLQFPSEDNASLFPRAPPPAVPPLLQDSRPSTTSTRPNTSARPITSSARNRPAAFDADPIRPTTTSSRSRPLPPLTDRSDGTKREIPRIVNAFMSEYAWGGKMWQPKLWVEARAEAVKTGTPGSVNALVQIVRTNTEYAINEAHYHVFPAGTRVDLNLIPPEASWLGRESVREDAAQLEATDMEHSRLIRPPVLTCDMSALDCVVVLRKVVAQTRPIVLAAEVLDFDDQGSVAVARASAMFPDGLPLRTDIGRFLQSAQVQLRDSKANTKLHLRANDDPYVVYLKDVTAFRGSRDDGYPFLTEPVHFHAVVTAMRDSRPDVQVVTGKPNRQWYRDPSSQASFLDRLSLIGLAAIKMQKDCEAARPILVMGSFPKQPRDSVANSLKQWRRRFGSYFHSIFLCTEEGGSKSEREGRETSLAHYFDDIINSHVYKAIESEKLARNLMPWHWDAGQMRLAISMPKLIRVASLVAVMVARGEAPGSAKKESKKRQKQGEKRELQKRTSGLASKASQAIAASRALEALTLSMRSSIRADRNGHDSESDVSSKESETEEESEDDDCPPEQSLPEPAPRASLADQESQSISGFRLDYVPEEKIKMTGAAQEVMLKSMLHERRSKGSLIDMSDKLDELAPSAIPIQEEKELVTNEMDLGTSATEHKKRKSAVKHTHDSAVRRQSGQAGQSYERHRPTSASSAHSSAIVQSPNAAHSRLRKSITNACSDDRKSWQPRPSIKGIDEQEIAAGVRMGSKAAADAPHSSRSETELNLREEARRQLTSPRRASTQQAAQASTPMAKSSPVAAAGRAAKEDADVHSKEDAHVHFRAVDSIYPVESGEQESDASSQGEEEIETLAENLGARLSMKWEEESPDARSRRSAGQAFRFNDKVKRESIRALFRSSSKLQLQERSSSKEGA